jgi:hypothetical protein
MEGQLGDQVNIGYVFFRGTGGGHIYGKPSRVAQAFLLFRAALIPLFRLSQISVRSMGCGSRLFQVFRGIDPQARRQGIGGEVLCFVY